MRCTELLGWQFRQAQHNLGHMAVRMMDEFSVHQHNPLHSPEVGYGPGPCVLANTSPMASMPGREHALGVISCHGPPQKQQD